MTALSRHTGAPLTEAEHIAQSIGDILTTPVGSRVMRRTYGAHVFDLIDAPANAHGALQVIAAAADALARWEPRITMTSASVRPSADGRATIRVHAVTRAGAAPISAAVLLGALA